MMLRILFLIIIANINYNAVKSASPEKPTTIQAKSSTKPLITDEVAAAEFLNAFNIEVNIRCAKRTLANWNYASNKTEVNRANETKSVVDYGKFMKGISESAAKYDWTNFKDEQIKRQFMFISMQGGSVLSEEKFLQYITLKQTMETIYSSAKVCEFINKTKSTKCDLSLEPEITEIFRQSRDTSQLKSMWLQFRNQSGKKMRGNYSALSNIVYEAALANKFPDASHYDTRAYESPTLKEDLQIIWKQLSPFYQQLHAYVRRKLRDYYMIRQNLNIPKHGPIPAHLLGNMWSQSWSNVYDLVVPYPHKKNIDVTSTMFEKQLSPYNMTRIAEEFFVSLGFPPLPEEFWSGSILTKPTDREIICHASAWDMCDGKNFWIKQCTRVNMEDLITLHHEMGHIQYQIQYKNLPKLFRDGANPGFHEAIGDVIALSVQTPKHLHSIGLLDVVEDDKEAEINYLLSMALDKIAFLPFAYLVDKWRWDVFQKVIKPEDYNCAWWKLRTEYQGISPPETRTEQDFDPGAKYHVAANAGYIKYFVSFIVQFQFHQALCEIAKQYDPTQPNMPLHKCDIHGNKEAGQKLMRMLQLGASKPWPEAMKVLTGKKSMTAEPILAYFQPLMDWLERDNNLHNVTIGWKEEKPGCVKKSMSSLLVTPQLSLIQFILLSVIVLVIN